MNILKRTMAMFLVLCMLVGMVPMTAFADEIDSTDPGVTESVENSEETLEEIEEEIKEETSEVVEEEIKEETSEVVEEETEEEASEVIEEEIKEETSGKIEEETEKEAFEEIEEEVKETTEEITEVTASDKKQAKLLEPQANGYAVEQAELTYASDYRILHLDCGRKYFTADWIKALINEMAVAGYTHLELAFGNDGLRFLLDDMSVGDYTDEQVTDAVQQGNKEYYDFGTNELTQSEMDAIIAHANSKGIEIIPLLNNPGHMNAIVSAASTLTGSDAGYNGSSSTVNLENAAAVSFTQGLLEKYINYFDSKGCNEFNFGADEYANDVYSEGSMGFGALVSVGKYQLYVDYVNEVAQLIKGYGMVPVAFNDGIYFNQNTAYSFDKQIMVAFWTSGWSGYQSASADTMASLGHKMINVNGDYYYVLGKSDKWDSNGYTYASNWSNTAFMGSNVSEPAGSMFCIWCDYPDAETETQIAANTRMILRAMAAEMQGKDANSVTGEIVSSGFNADGTIAEDYNNVTVKHETTTIEVTGRDLTSVEVTEVENKPVIADATDVLAWDITPYVGNEKYTNKGIVKLPVPFEWNTNLVRGFYVENQEVILVEGTYEDGFYTFEMPHFSVGGVMQRDANASDKVIELNVGESKTELIEGVDLTGQTFTPEPEGIANVAVKVQSAVTGTTISNTAATTLENGATYIIRVFNTDYALSANKGSEDWGTDTLAFEYNTLEEIPEHFWKLEASGNGYKLKNNDYYLNLGTGINTAYLDENGEVFSIASTDTGWTIGNQNRVYINALGGLNGNTAGGWTNDSTRFELYKVTKATDVSTTVTFNGVSAGEATVNINNTVYKIVVHGTKDITIKYVDGNNNIIKTETVTVADNATTHTVSNFNYNGKFYTVSNPSLAITPDTVTEYTATVTETEEDLSQVSPLTLEYWITNQQVTINGVTSESLSAEEVYGEAGVNFSDLVPVSNNAENPKVFWKGWLLPEGYHQESDVSQSPDMCTDPNGTLVRKIRYWNGQWAYFNGTEWTAIKNTDQLVAYYLQRTQITDEVTTNVTDWGETYSDWKNYSNSGHWFWANYVENGSKFVFLDFAVVYEDGTQTPNTFPVDDTWFFHFDGCSAENPRVLKPISFDETGDYEIWKITVTDGTSQNYESASLFDSEYDDSTETIVWSEDMGGTPQVESLSYTANQSGKLIRIYVRAVETEDTLTVVYYDEKFSDTLYSYNISVEAGKSFINDIVNDSAFIGNESRIDVSNAYIVNALGKNQNFQTDLTKVPEAVGKYRNDLYSYTGSTISQDGKTLYLYYNINTSVLSPNFVVDFGLPIVFPVTDLLGEGTEFGTNDSVGNLSARYGTLTYKDGSFTYTPTSILQNIDVLTIELTIDGKTATTNVGVTPATTVYYEESFINWDSKWTGGNAAITVGNQTTEVLEKKNNNFGYDPVYANTTGASNGTNATTSDIGAKATFTFTGNGVQVFANCTETSGYVAVEVKDSNGAIVNLSMVDTVVDAGTTGATTGQTDSLYGLPIVSLVDLQNMKHDTYTVTITKIMDTEPVYIDGIRVFNTMADSSIFLADKEDNPDFYELRDMVLNAIGVADGTSEDYKTMYEQVYDAVEGASALIVDASVTYDESSTVQDLLDNGPKNEIYLYAGQTLNFKVTTNRVMQIGMKAPQDATTASIRVSGDTEAKSQIIRSSVDMFYTLANKADSETTYTVQITNTGDKILSITELKICDDPNAAFVPFTVEDIKELLCDDSAEETPVEPEKPEEPEEPEEPVIVYADAVLNVNVVDYAGKKLGTVELSSNGVEGEKAVFTAEEILAAAQEQVPEKYALVDETAVADTEVVYGQEQEFNVQIGKVAALKITFVNLLGRKQGTSTIEVVQTADGYCKIAASDIKALAPARRRAIWFTPVYVSYGSTDSIVVPVI